MVATPGNSLNITAAGLVKFDGTSAFSGVTTTQHDLLIGAASNGITSVAPSATSGVPVISQGASSDPTFGTAVVAGGGTGLTSATAYAVLCGGTTSTGNFQSIAGVGTSGQVLTSNGAGALPTFQAAASGGNLVLIQSQTASNSASISFTTGITSTYNTYLFVYTAVPATNNAIMQIQVSTDGGSTYKNTGYQAGINVAPYNSAAWGNGNSTTLVQISGGQNNTAGHNTSGFMYLTNLASSNFANFNGEFVYYNGTPLTAFGVATGNAAFASVNALQVTESTGNISSGTFTLFGVLE